MMAGRPRWAFLHPFQLRLRRGVEAWLWHLSAALADLAVAVDIITWDGPLPIPNYVQRAGVQVRKVPSFPYYQRIGTVPFYVWLLGTQEYDHIFVNFAGHGEGLALWALQRVSRTPFSVVFHFPRSQVPHRYEEFRRWKYPERAEHMVAVSHFVAGQVEAWSGRSCSVIGHGVDVRQFRASVRHRREVRETLQIPPDANVMVTVTALEERKGVQWGIRALDRIRASHPETHYLILGDGRHRETLENLTRALDVQEYVHFLGWVDDVSGYLSAADLALLLSYGEASPVALLEYAAAELPVVTSRHPPFPELVRAEWGAMVDETDTSVVARLVTDLLKDVEQRASMGAKAREWVRANHVWSQVAKQYRALIR